MLGVGEAHVNLAVLLRFCHFGRIRRGKEPQLSLERHLWSSHWATAQRAILFNGREHGDANILD
jgi:hypothetical protein